MGRVSDASLCDRVLSLYKSSCVRSSATPGVAAGNFVLVRAAAVEKLAVPAGPCGNCRKRMLREMFVLTQAAYVSVQDHTRPSGVS
jgi:hypothetical protein